MAPAYTHAHTQAKVILDIILICHKSPLKLSNELWHQFSLERNDIACVFALQWFTSFVRTELKSIEKVFRQPVEHRATSDNWKILERK